MRTVQPVSPGEMLEEEYDLNYFIGLVDINEHNGLVQIVDSEHNVIEDLHFLPQHSEVEILGHFNDSKHLIQQGYAG